MAGTRWWDGVLTAVLRGWARYLGDGSSPRIRDLDLTPDGVPDARELRRRAERAELRLAQLLNNGPSVSRPVWDAEVVQAEHDVNDLWRRWADTALR